MAGRMGRVCLAGAGIFIMCQNAKVTGATFDGGYGEYMVAPQEAVAAMPDGLDFAEAGPLMCAGITTFNALRHSGALPGDLAGGSRDWQGWGIWVCNSPPSLVITPWRLGADRKMPGWRRSSGPRSTSTAEATNAAAGSCRNLGGARVITLATATSSKSMSDLVDGLGPNGKLLVVGAPLDPIQATPVQLIFHKAGIQEWSSGIPTDSEDTMRVAVLTGVRAHD